MAISVFLVCAADEAGRTCEAWGLLRWHAVVAEQSCLLTESLEGVGFFAPVIVQLITDRLPDFQRLAEQKVWRMCCTDLQVKQALDTCLLTIRPFRKSGEERKHASMNGLSGRYAAEGQRFRRHRQAKCYRSSRQPEGVHEG
eukprot:4498882-Amphidinium_carterae.1